MARRLPSLNALRAFEAAARHESFTEAANELFVTHAAVSRHIRDLEEWLGIELFRRTGRGVALTEAGERYGRDLTPLFDGLAESTRRVMAQGSTRRLAGWCRGWAASARPTPTSSLPSIPTRRW
jgi:LysR family transcriptional regulator, glycine cleavage system transcriptional activator